MHYDIASSTWPASAPPSVANEGVEISLELCEWIYLFGEFRDAGKVENVNPAGFLTVPGTGDARIAVFSFRDLKRLVNQFVIPLCR
jgi:hypothetical protein